MKTLPAPAQPRPQKAPAGAVRSSPSGSSSRVALPELPAGPLPGRERLAVLVTLLLAWALLFGPQLFAGRVFVIGDAPGYRPYTEFSRARWREHHERTFWNPYVFTGIPAAASLADPRPQYLPDGLLEAWDALDRAPGVPRLWGPLLAHLAGMLAAAGLARALWRARAAGMAWAGLAWGLTPNLVVPFAFGHDAQFVTASLMPVTLLALHGVVAAASRRAACAAALGLALAFALAAAAGHPQFVLFTLLLGTAFAFERARRFDRPERLALAVAGVVLGAAMAAAVWWPALLYGGLSVRGGQGLPLGEVQSFSFAWRDYLTLAWPWGVGFGGNTYWGGMRATDYPNYLGVVALLALPAAWAARRDAGRGAATVLAVAGLLGLILALGTRLPLYEVAYRVVPLVSSLRVAVAGLIVTQLAAALLSARGLEWLLARAPAPRWVLPGAAAALLLAAALSAGGPLQDLLRDAVLAARPQLDPETVTRAAESGVQDLALRLGLVALALAALGAPGRARPWRPLALAALLICDLAIVDLPLLGKGTGSPARLEPPSPPPIARLAATDPLNRAFPMDRDLFYSNAWIAWRARSVGGLHGAVNRRWDDLRREGLLSREGMLRALAVRWFEGKDLQAQDTTRVEVADRAPSGMTVYQLRHPLPRAYAVPEVIAVREDLDVLRCLYDADFVPERIAYTTEPRAAGRYPGSAGATLRWRRDDPDRLELDVDAPQMVFVVVADAWLPGWSVAVDGVRAPLFRVDHLLRGVAVPAGSHRVTMRYEPPGWAVGVPVTRVAFLLWLGLAVVAGVALARGRERAESPAAAS
jgi:hypothetical protein